ncbi:pentapeptide repeat-containing protein [Roseibium sp. MB-4]
MVNDGDKSGAVPDTPELKPEAIWPWLIAVAVFAGLGTIGLTLWVYLTNEDTSKAAELIRTFGPLFVGAGAAVTFMTVIWRGAIINRQAAEQKRQNDSQDQVELGLLLDKASEYLADDKAGRRDVGLAMIETVIMAENSKYAVPALDILLSHYVLLVRTDSRLRRVADRIITAAALLGRSGTAGQEFDFSDSEGKIFEDHYLSIPPGFPPSFIKNCKIYWRSVVAHMKEYDEIDLNLGFEKCLIGTGLGSERTEDKLRILHRYYDCYLRNCNIVEVDGYLRKCHFLGCDFSGATIRAANLSQMEIAQGNCWYSEGQEPRFIELDEEQQDQVEGRDHFWANTYCVARG